MSAPLRTVDRPRVVVVGGANMDVKARSRAPVVGGTSNPGSVTTSPGGVGRNIAENLARLGTPVALVAAVGRDPLGDQLLAATSGAGVDTTHVRRGENPTGTYTAVLDADGELVVAVSDMTASDTLPAEVVAAAGEVIAAAELLVVDGNLPLAALRAALDLAAGAGVRAVLEPVSAPKAAALSGLPGPERPLFAVTPTTDELAALTGRSTATDDELSDAVAALHERGVAWVWVRRGRAGSLLSGPDGRTVIPSVAGEVVDVTGAGDALLAAFGHALLSGDDPPAAAAYGHAAAALTVASDRTVRPDLTDTLVRSLLP